MKTIALPLLIVFIALFVFVPHQAIAATASIESLSPGAVVPAKQLVTFKLSLSGFYAPYFQISDSFPNSSVGSSNISTGGQFSWAPTAKDAGQHVLTITARDFENNVATVSVTLTITPPPSATLSVSPSSAAIPVGTPIAFAAGTAGFTNPIYSWSDSFSGSSLSNASGVSGQFTWTPDLSQEGDHTVTVYVSDSSGASASASVPVHIGPLPSLKIVNLRPGTNVSVGTSTTFSVFPVGYTPTVFGVYDSFSGSTSLSPNAVSNNGLFSWIPQGQDIGVHVITITGSIGPFGKSASTTQTLIVGEMGKPVSSASQTPSVTAALQPSSSVSAYIFTSALKIGSEGAEVTQLQKLLSSLGFFNGEATGYFGPVTAEAVRKFQAAKGIAQLGTVGPQTRAALNGTPSASAPAAPSVQTAMPATNGYVFKNFMGYGEDPNDGPDVMELQKRLSSLGFFTGEATGYFGAATAAAVKKFQTANGIEATGYVGSLTRAALNK